MITITALDGTSNTTNPVALAGWNPQAESGNIIHRMLQPGAIAVVLRGDLPRSGSLALRYASDTEVEEARELLGRVCAFTLAHTGRDVVDMTFVRDGTMSAAIHDAVKNLWLLEVGFQEIQP